jgi:hypothetical protein
MRSNRAAAVVPGMQQAPCFRYSGVNRGFKHLLIV